jgi:hypothetical protein
LKNARHVGWGAALLCATPTVSAQTEALLPVGSGPLAPAAYALSWVRGQGAEECPAGRALAAEVERRIGRPVFDVAAPHSFEVQVTRVGGVFHSDVFVRDESGKTTGHRALQSDEPGCEALFGATALAIALVIDPEAASREPGAPAEAAFETPPPPPAPVPAVSPPAPAPAPASREAPKPLAAPVPKPSTPVTLSLRGHVSGGLVPEGSPGFALAFSARPTERWGFAISGWYTAPKPAERGVGSIEVGLTRASAALTFDAVRARRVRLDLAAGTSLGALHLAVRTPAPVTDTGDFWFVALELGAGMKLGVSEGVFLELGGATLVPLGRQEFLARGQEAPIWRQPGVAGVGFAGVGMLFP